MIANGTCEGIECKIGKENKNSKKYVHGEREGRIFEKVQKLFLQKGRSATESPQPQRNSRCLLARKHLISAETMRVANVDHGFISYHDVDGLDDPSPNTLLHIGNTILLTDCFD